MVTLNGFFLKIGEHLFLSSLDFYFVFYFYFHQCLPLFPFSTPHAAAWSSDLWVKNSGRIRTHYENEEVRLGSEKWLEGLFVFRVTWVCTCKKTFAITVKSLLLRELWVKWRFGCHPRLASLEHLTFFLAADSTISLGKIQLRYRGTNWVLVYNWCKSVQTQRYYKELGALPCTYTSFLCY